MPTGSVKPWSHLVVRHCYGDPTSEIVLYHLKSCVGRAFGARPTHTFRWCSDRREDVESALVAGADSTFVASGRIFHQCVRVACVRRTGARRGAREAYVSHCVLRLATTLRPPYDT